MRDMNNDAQSIQTIWIKKNSDWRKPSKRVSTLLNMHLMTVRETVTVSQRAQHKGPETRAAAWISPSFVLYQL